MPYQNQHNSINHSHSLYVQGDKINPSQTHKILRVKNDPHLIIYEASTGRSCYCTEVEESQIEKAMCSLKLNGRVREIKTNRALKKGNFFANSKLNVCDYFC